MRLPFFYGWVMVAVTSSPWRIGVNARTAFSLFFPPISRNSAGNAASPPARSPSASWCRRIVSPLIGRLMDRAGPRAVMELGVVLMGGGLLLAPLTSGPGIST